MRSKTGACCWAIKELKITGEAVGRRLKISDSAVSRAVWRGEKIAAEKKL
jgi:hypothetical protein